MKFAHRLALALGWLDVEQMLSSIPEWKFRRWQLYCAIDPWGAERDDWRIAQLICVYLNSKTRRLARKYRPADFMWQGTKPEKSAKEMFGMIQQYFEIRSATKKASKGARAKKEKQKPK